MLHPTVTRGSHHVFILWRAEPATEHGFLHTLSSRFEILAASRFHWSAEGWEENLLRFYGALPAGPQLKLTEVGRKPLLAVICHDLAPRYGFHRTQGGNLEHTNLNAIDCKNFLRSEFEGNYCHCSSTPKEYLRQSTLLFGRSIHEKRLALKWDGAISEYHCDLLGHKGWASASDFFLTLNHCCNYVVLRNFEMLPDTIAPEDDVDVLTDDIECFAAAANAEPTGSSYCRYLVDIAGNMIPFDLRCLGDGYYDTLWQKDILSSKTLTEKGVPIPNDSDYFFSLFYHVKIHKTEVQERHRNQLALIASRINFLDFSLKDVDNDRMAAAILSGFLKFRQYQAPNRRLAPNWNRKMLKRISGHSIPTAGIILRRSLLNQLLAYLPKKTYAIIPQAVKSQIKRYLDK